MITLREAREGGGTLCTRVPLRMGRGVGVVEASPSLPGAWRGGCCRPGPAVGTSGGRDGLGKGSWGWARGMPRCLSLLRDRPGVATPAGEVWGPWSRSRLGSWRGGVGHVLGGVEEALAQSLTLSEVGEPPADRPLHLGPLARKARTFRARPWLPRLAWGLSPSPPLVPGWSPPGLPLAFRAGEELGHL